MPELERFRNVEPFYLAFLQIKELKSKVGKSFV